MEPLTIFFFWILEKMSFSSKISNLSQSSNFSSIIASIIFLKLIALVHTWVSLLSQILKNLLAMQETWVWSLGQEDSLEKGIATHSNILAWEIPWTEKHGRLYSLWGCKESDTTDWLSTHTHLETILYFTFSFLTCNWSSVLKASASS